MLEFVSVPVPVDRVQEVYELLARKPVRAFGADGSGPPEGWSEQLIDRMFIESSEAMRSILLAIARTAPGWMTTDDVALAAGLTARQVVASLGPFKKRVRGRYGMDTWPFETREFVDAGVFKYSMSVQPAERILELEVQMEENEKGHTGR